MSLLSTDADGVQSRKLEEWHQHHSNLHSGAPAELALQEPEAGGMGLDKVRFLIYSATQKTSK